MAFTVEDGSGVASANAYCTLAFVDGYFTDRGRTDWTGDNAVKQAAIIRATDHIERRFGHRWKGKKADGDNTLSWPRSGVSLPDGTTLGDAAIPDGVMRACAEYARLALTRSELDPVPMEVGTDKTNKVRRKMTEQQVGPIKTRSDEEYEDIAQKVDSSQRYGRKPSTISVMESSLMEYPQADLFLDPYLTDPSKKSLEACPVVSGDSDCLKQFPDEDWSKSYDNTGRTYRGWSGSRYGD